jgi:ubiquinone/menaquinone biosynthesis C-methylase UbiE
MPDDNLQRRYRLRVALFLAAAIFVVALLGTAYQAVQTLIRLNVVERERDQWQRPVDILQPMHLQDGSVAAEVGCGAGYFVLKLSSMVGDRGKVLAVDIRREPLFFLWMRAIVLRRHNIAVIHAEPDDPHLPADAVDAVLIANTYHELVHPGKILTSILRSLHPGGRLIVADRAPRPGSEMKEHAIALKVAQSEIRVSGFEIVSQHDRFIDRPGDEPWWLIVVRKPGRDSLSTEKNRP